MSGTDSDDARRVRVEVADGVRTLTLDSQHNRNALSRQLVAELQAGLDGARDDPDTRVVVLAAEGRAFCAGADLAEASEGDGRDPGRSLLAVLRSMLTLPQPVVARVHAPVRAGGIGLVTAADIAIGAHEASFAFTEVRLGLTPAIISLTVLPRLTSRAGAYDFLTGRTLDGARAAEEGLLTRAVAGGQLDASVEEEVATLLRGSPQGLDETKRLVNRELVAGLDRDGEAMVELSNRLFASEEARTGMRAFLDRRDPPWVVERDA
jgi:enoyl-CoA hydratase/carnithine racemase